MPDEPEDRLIEITALDGFVLMDWPGPAAVTMTAEEAEEVGARLGAAAVVAYAQRAGAAPTT